MKRLLSIILMVTLVLSLAACGGNKGEKITLYEDTWEGENVKLAVDFYYPEGADITLEGDEEYPNWIDMKYNSKNKFKPLARGVFLFTPGPGFE